MGRLQNSPSIGWVHPKSTHYARPLAWGNKKLCGSQFRNFIPHPFFTTQFKETTPKRVIRAFFTTQQPRHD